jgi:hypothetical protein
VDNSWDDLKEAQPNAPRSSTRTDIKRIDTTLISLNIFSLSMTNDQGSGPTAPNLFKSRSGNLSIDGYSGDKKNPKTGEVFGFKTNRS